MSWAAHNPEAWEAIERSAVAKWLNELLRTEAASHVMEVLNEVAVALQSEHSEVFHAMMRQGAYHFLEIEEADYHGQRIDAVMSVA